MTNTTLPDTPADAALLAKVTAEREQLRDALVWALAEGGWRLLYYARDVPAIIDATDIHHPKVRDTDDAALLAERDAAYARADTEHAARVRLVAEYDRLYALLEQARPVLRRVWAQFAPYGESGRKWHGGVNVLQDVSTLADDVDAALAAGEPSP